MSQCLRDICVPESSKKKTNATLESSWRFPTLIVLSADSVPDSSNVWLTSDWGCESETEWDIKTLVAQSEFKLSGGKSTVSHLLPHLFMPLQQHGAAVVRGLLKASVDVLHQQVHPCFVQRADGFLYVAALKAAHHLDHQQLCSLLHTHTHIQCLWLNCWSNTHSHHLHHLSVSNWKRSFHYRSVNWSMISF